MSSLYPLYPGIGSGDLEALELQGVTVYEPRYEWLASKLGGARRLQQELSSTPLARRLEVVGELGREWREKLEGGALENLKRRVAEATGYSPALVEMEFEFVLEVFNPENIRRLLDAALLGGSRSLEEPVEVAPGEYLRNLPAGPALIIGSGNSVVPPLIPATVSLVVGNFTILRPSIANFEAVREAYSGLASLPPDDPLGAALLVSYFAHDSRSLRGLLEKAPLGVVNYWGGEPGRTLVAKAVAGNPHHPRLVVNGPMTGFAIIDSTSASADAARALALEVVLYDQQLCSSPTQAAFIGSPREAAEFASMLAEALEEVGGEYPLSLDSLPYPLFVLRRSLELAGARVYAGSDPRNPWTVAVSEGGSALARVPQSAVVPLHLRRRFIEIIAVDSAGKALELVESLPRNPAFAGVDRVQTLSLAVGADTMRLVLDNLHALGVYRVVPLGESYLRTPVEPYDGVPMAAAFSYTAYVRVRGK